METPDGNVVEAHVLGIVYALNANVLVPPLAHIKLPVPGSNDMLAGLLSVLPVL